MRTYKRKTTRGLATTEQLEMAAKAVREEKITLKVAAEKFNIHRMTLYRYLKKSKTQDHPVMGYTSPRQIFTEEQENILKDYLIQMAVIFNNYTYKDIRQLAYEYAVTYKIKAPANWIENKMAGLDWTTMFLRRNPEIPVKKRARADNSTSFNAQLVKMFFDKLSEVMYKTQLANSENDYSIDHVKVEFENVET